MGIVKGLQGISSMVERSSGADRSDGPRAVWLKVGANESVKIRFLQELSPDSPNYDSNRGLGFAAEEHSNPKDYRRKALCSIEDQGRCFGCEQHRRDPKAGWKVKSRLYINVMVSDGKEDPYVAILSQGSGPKSATPTIFEHAVEFQTLTDGEFKLKRSGTGQETSYTLLALPRTDFEVPDDVQLYDLEKVAVRDVPYAEQEAFYLGVDSGSSSSVNTSEEW